MKEGWKYKKLGEVCTIERGGSPRPISDYITEEENGINWIKIGDAVEGSKYIKSTAEKIKPEGMKKSRFVHKGDFILSNSMSFGKPYILGVDGCIHDGWLVIHDDNNTFNKDFLYYYLGSPTIYSEFKKLAVGGVVNNLNSNLVRGVKVAIPPLSEQQQIVEELDLLSSIIEKKKAQLNELDNLAQSLFYEMFGDISTGTNILSDFCKIMGGKRIPKGLSFSDHITAHPYLRATDMKNGTILKGDIKYIDNCVFEKIKRYIITKDDVYLTNVGVNLGMAGVIPDEFDNANLTENAVKLVFDKNKIDKYFLSAYLNSNIIQSEIQKRKMTVGVPKLAIFRIQTLPFILPPLNLQQQFASKIEAIERQKELIKQSIKEVETLFNSRMDYYFN